VLIIVAHEGALFSTGAARAIKLSLVWLTVAVTALSMFQYLARSRYILEESATA
jgi:hypothetical protein